MTVSIVGSRRSFCITYSTMVRTRQLPAFAFQHSRIYLNGYAMSLYCFDPPVLLAYVFQHFWCYFEREFSFLVLMCSCFFINIICDKDHQFLLLSLNTVNAFRPNNITCIYIDRLNDCFMKVYSEYFNNTTLIHVSKYIIINISQVNQHKQNPNSHYKYPTLYFYSIYK